MYRKNKKLLANSQDQKLTGILYLASKPVDTPICLKDDATTEEILDSFRNIISGEVKKHNNKCIFRLFIG